MVYSERKRSCIILMVMCLLRKNSSVASKRGRIELNCKLKFVYTSIRPLYLYRKFQPGTIAATGISKKAKSPLTLCVEWCNVWRYRNATIAQAQDKLSWYGFSNYSCVKPTLLAVRMLHVNDNYNYELMGLPLSF